MSLRIQGPNRRLGRLIWLLAFIIPVLVLGCGADQSASNDTTSVDLERSVAIPMRDGVILRANVWKPPGGGPFPVLVYRTPYGKDSTEDWYDTHLRAVERGYAVVIQDVRGRYESDGVVRALQQ